MTSAIKQSLTRLFNTLAGRKTSELSNKAAKQLSDYVDYTGINPEKATAAITNMVQNPSTNSLATQLSTTGINYADPTTRRLLRTAWNDAGFLSPQFRSWQGEGWLTVPDAPRVDDLYPSLSVPLPVYNGAPIANRNQLIMSNGLSPYLNTDKRIARGYALDAKGREGDIAELYTNIQDPFVVDAQKFMDFTNLNRASVERANPDFMPNTTQADIAKLQQKYYDADNAVDAYYAANRNKLIEKGKSPDMGVSSADSIGSLVRRFGIDSYENPEAVQGLLDLMTNRRNARSELFGATDQLTLDNILQRNSWLYKGAPSGSNSAVWELASGKTITTDGLNQLGQDYIMKPGYHDGIIIKDVVDNPTASLGRQWSTDVIPKSPNMVKSTTGNFTFNPNSNNYYRAVYGTPLATGELSEADVNPVTSFAQGAVPGIAAGARFGGVPGAIYGGIGGGIANMVGDYTFTNLLNALDEYQQDPVWDWDIPPEMYNGVM